MSENVRELEKHHRRRTGQTLAEFALTLPILLLLTFGTVEFGRFFQAWVTIQNAAREATRYATTGQYDQEKYDLEALLPCTYDTTGPNSQGRYVLHYPVAGQPNYFVETYQYEATPDSGIFQMTGESLFATIYDGENCDPGKPEHLEYRRDILRIASIYDQARRGAAGLSLDQSRIRSSIEWISNFWFDLWEHPMENEEEPRFFHVDICSSRGLIDSSERSYPTADSDFPTLRFMTVTREEDIFRRFTTLDADAVERDLEYTLPFCMMNELRSNTVSESATQTNGVITLRPFGADTATQRQNTANYGVRWLDAGGPGDRVSVYVRFNHPLITPLGLAEFVTMRAQRSGVNESFRASRALNAVQGAPPGIAEPDDPDPIINPTPVPASPVPPEVTPPTAVPPTAEPPTAEPFTCDQFFISPSISYDRTRAYISVTNSNRSEAGVLSRVILRWVRSALASPGMYISSMSLGGEVHWLGADSSGFIDTALFTGDDLANWTEADRVIPPNTINPVFWSGQFLDIGGNLYDVADQWTFAGTTFYFSNLDGSQTCELSLPLPDPDVTPTDTPVPPGPTTPPFTPDCVGPLITVEFGRMLNNGVVSLIVINGRNQPGPLVGFNIIWPDPALPRPEGLGLSAGTIWLEKITVGGADPDDPQSTVIWRNNNPPGDLDPQKLGPVTTENDGKYWRGDSFSGVAYTFPPADEFGNPSVTTLYLDYAGTSTSLSASPFGMGSWSFHGSTFEITCDPTGEGNGGGGGGRLIGDIDLSGTGGSPTPSATPLPTNTPAPTLPPTNTPRPTLSFTPSSTFTPSLTFTPTLTFTPGGGREGGGGVGGGGSGEVGGG